MESLLEIRDLSVSFDTSQGELKALRNVNLSLHPGEVLALVGESGCGKSVLCKTIMKLLPENARIKNGRILAAGKDITDYREKEMERLRGRLFSMVFQNPMTVLNPAVSVGEQIGEAVSVRYPKMKREEVLKRVLELMDLTGIPEAEKCCKMYPCHFSGGMRQRSVMAIALACDPGILLADEPTTALDVTVQAQILDLLLMIQKKLKTATLLVSHDLSVVARVADRIAVMYAGKIIETGTSEDIFYDPRHPYTQGLLRSLPFFAEKGEELYTIPGMPPSLIRLPRGDAFACRNEYALAIDYEKEPPMFRISDTHYAATWLLDPRAPSMENISIAWPDMLSGNRPEGGGENSV